MATLCDIKLRHAVFQSDISNKVADNLGYITDVALRYEMNLAVSIDLLFIRNISVLKKLNA